MSPARPHRVTILGESLTALAAAARLARQGHEVRLVPAGRLGGRAASRRLRGGDDGPIVLVDDLAPVTTLPAAWRDLVKKSGQPMAGFLNAAHLDLVEAPPAVHRFSDGTEVALPADRGGHTKALEPIVGRAQALAWAAVLDDLDGVWQAMRRHGAERTFDTDAALDPALAARVTMTRLADRLGDPRLRQLLVSAASRAGATTPSGAPALLGSRWSIERTFGRWQLLDQDSALSHPLSALTPLLVDRAREAGAVIVDDGLDSVATDDLGDAVIDTRTPEPPAKRWPWQRPAVWASAPQVDHTIVDWSVVADGLVHERVDHHSSGHPVVSYTRRLDDDRALVTTHDHTRPGLTDGSAGWTIDTLDQWRSRPTLGGGERHWRASAASHAGNEPWAELLTAALVTYEAHEALTGHDIRPTNKLAPRPPRR